MADVVIDELLDVAKDVSVPLVGGASHSSYCGIMLRMVFIICGSWLGVEHERNGEEAFDPFYQLISPVCLEMGCQYASRHAGFVALALRAYSTL